MPLFSRRADRRARHGMPRHGLPGHPLGVLETMPLAAVRPGSAASDAAALAPPLASAPLVLEAYGCTDPGRERAVNEDAFLVEPPGSAHVRARGQLLVVADGMGGHAAGEVASAITVQAVRSAYYLNPSGSIVDSLADAISAASGAIVEAAHADVERSGMGSTVVAAVVHGSSLVVAHVGDSRAYLVRYGRASRLTRDHSWVEGQVDAGVLTADEADQHPDRNILLRALGRRTDVEVDAAPYELAPGDVLVLCSDGLTNVVGDAELATIASQLPPRACAERLVALANSRGAPDNVTVVVASVGAAGTGRPDVVAPRTRLPIALGAIALAVAATVGLLAGTLSAVSGSSPPVSTSDALPVATETITAPSAVTTETRAPTTGPAVAVPPVGQTPSTIASPTRRPDAGLGTPTGSVVPEPAWPRWPEGARTRVRAVTPPAGLLLRQEPTDQSPRLHQFSLGSKVEVVDEPSYQRQGPGCGDAWLLARPAGQQGPVGYACADYLDVEATPMPTRSPGRSDRQPNDVATPAPSTPPATVTPTTPQQLTPTAGQAPPTTPQPTPATPRRAALTTPSPSAHIRPAPRRRVAPTALLLLLRAQSERPGEAGSLGEGEAS